MKDRISAMVDRFLGWKLPKTFGPDAGISFNPTELQKSGVHPWPIGTNLLSATEAREMIEHIVADDHRKLRQTLEAATRCLQRNDWGTGFDRVQDARALLDGTPGVRASRHDTFPKNTPTED